MRRHLLEDSSSVAAPCSIGPKRIYPSTDRSRKPVPRQRGSDIDVERFFLFSPVELEGSCTASCQGPLTSPSEPVSLNAVGALHHDVSRVHPVRTSHLNFLVLDPKMSTSRASSRSAASRGESSRRGAAQPSTGWFGTSANVVMALLMTINLSNTKESLQRRRIELSAVRSACLLEVD